MKKISFLIVSIVIFATAAAQDTINALSHDRSNYIYPDCLPVLDVDTWRWSLTGIGWLCGATGQTAKVIDNHDTLTIYGIAASLIVDIGDSWCTCYDPSPELLHEYLRLYKIMPMEDGTTDTLQCITQTEVHMNVTPISYYADYSKFPGNPAYEQICPMYECYFDSPAVVTEPFAVGLTHSVPSYYDSVSGQTFGSKYPRFMYYRLGISYLQCNDRIINQNIYKDISNNDSIVWWTEHTYPSLGKFVLIYPILTPRDTTLVHGDTTAVGDTLVVSDTVVTWHWEAVGDTVVTVDTLFDGNDTVFVFDTVVVFDSTIVFDTTVLYDTILGIGQPSLPDRMTSVMPNPANERVKVLSSIGMSEVDVYDMSGRKVKEVRMPSGTLTTTIDTREWPSGAYVLRIKTLQGIATKKLAVRR